MSNVQLLINAALLILAVTAAYKIGYGSAISDVGDTIADIRAVHDAELDAWKADNEPPFDWADAPVLYVATMRGEELRAGEWREDRHAGTRYEG